MHRSNFIKPNFYQYLMRVCPQLENMDTGFETDKLANGFHFRIYTISLQQRKVISFEKFDLR